jgi:pimeloyl-ACP methyl ester carboxylesterase
MRRVNMKSNIHKYLLGVLCFFAASVSWAEPAILPFYQEVSKMTPKGKLGEVIKREKIQTSIANAQAWRIAYISSDVGGRKTISTALVVAPVGQAPAEGRPIVAWSHGTTGTAQSCGPSQVQNPAVSLNQYFLVGGNSWTDYGLPNLESLIKEGYVVVGTDYQGLGGGGKHQYVVSATQGRDVINSVRAVGSLKEVSPGKKAVVYGWSQGGGATIAAASMPEYLTEKGTASDGIEFVGFVAMAPPDISILLGNQTLDQASADKLLSELVKNFSDNIFNFTHFAMTIWGTQAAFPQLKLTDIFTDTGAKTLDDVLFNKCIHVASDTLSYGYAADFKALLNKQPRNTLAWANAFIQGSIAPVKPVAPVVIYWGTKDTVVPPVMGQLYQKKMCALGGNVARVQLPGEQTHFTTPGAASPFYMPWIKDRLAGKSLNNACPKD